MHSSPPHLPQGLNIIPGIKVDTGLIPLYNGGPGEKWCRGLDSLAERCEKYYEQGARFAKWRTALQIDVENGCPTDLAIEIAAQDLARYARICQEFGLVPIVEPEILIDGTHDITTTARIQERVLTTVYAKLQVRPPRAPPRNPNSNPAPKPRPRPCPPHHQPSRDTARRSTHRQPTHPPLARSPPTSCPQPTHPLPVVARRTTASSSRAPCSSPR